MIVIWKSRKSWKFQNRVAEKVVGIVVVVVVVIAVCRFEILKQQVSNISKSISVCLLEEKEIFSSLFVNKKVSSITIIGHFSSQTVLE